MVNFIIAFCLFLYTSCESFDGSKLGRNCSKSHACGDYFVCGANGTCIECDTYSSCGNLNKNCFLRDFKITVKNQTTVTQLNGCFDKSLFKPLTVWEVLGTVACFVGGSLAASSGIGGGGIYIPILLLLSKYSNQQSVPCSTITIFGSAIANFFMLVFQKHPTQNKPLIDYNIVLVLEPIILAGTTGGVVLNLLFPDWLTLIILILILTITSIRTFCKGISQFKKERKQKKKENESDKERLVINKESINTDGVPGKALHDEEFKPEKDEEIRPINHSSSMDNNAYEEFNSDDEKEEVKTLDHSSVMDEEEKQNDKEEVLPLRAEHSSDMDEFDNPEDIKKKKIGKWKNLIIKIESFRIQFVHLLLLSFVWVVVLLISIFKGSEKTPSIIGLPKCGISYWIIFGMSFPFLFACSYLCSTFLFFLNKMKRKMGIKLAEEEMNWNFVNSFILPAIFFTAGLVAGMLGIGGGMIISPILLEIGLNPQVIMATSLLMIFFTSSSVSMQYVVEGILSYDYALWYAGFGFFSAVVGQIVITFLVKKFKSTWFIVFIISITIFCCTILMGVVGTKNIVTNIIEKNWDAFSFHQIC